MTDNPLTELSDFMERQEWSQAFQLAKQLRRGGTDDPLIDISLAVGFHERMQYREALIAADRALTDDPENELAAKIRASATSGLGWTKLATKMVEADGLQDRVEPYLVISEALRRRDYEAAESEALLFLEKEPGNSYVQAEYHAARWQGKHDTDSKRELERLFNAEELLRAGWGLARGFDIHGELRAAYEVWRRCTELEPGDPYSRIEMIEVVNRLDGHDAALVALDDLPADFAHLPETVYIKALTLIDAGRLADAENASWELVGLSAEDQRFSGLLFWVLRKRRRYHVLLRAFWFIMVHGHEPMDRMFRKFSRPPGRTSSKPKTS